MTDSLPYGTFDLVLTRDSRDAYLVTIQGSVHGTFADFKFFGPTIFGWSLAESIDAVRFVTITDAYLHAFFDRYLLGTPSTLLDGPPTDYPEVKFREYP